MARVVAALTAVLLTLAGVPAGIAAEPPPGSPATAPIGFEDDKLDTTCKALVQGVRTVVVNRTIEALPMHTRFGVFRGPGKRLWKHGSVCGGLEVLPTGEDSPMIEPGEALPIILKAKRAPTVGESRGGQVFKGSLAVYSDSGTASRLPLTIERRKATSVSPKPLLSSASGSEYTDVEWRSDVRPLPFGRADVSEDAVTLWVPIQELSKGESVSLGLNTGVGAVTGADDSAAVTYVRTETEPDARISRLGLHVPALLPGSYTGKVDLNGSEKEGGEIELALTVKDHWFWAAFAILLGLVIGLAAKHFAEVFLARRRLRQEVDSTLSERLRDALGLFRKVEGNPWPAAAFSVEDEAAELGRMIESKIGFALVEIDPKRIEELRKEIESVADRIDGLPVLAKKLAALTKSLASQPPLDKMPMLQNEDLVLGEAKLARDGRALLVMPRTPVKLSEIDALTTAVDEAINKGVLPLVNRETRIAALLRDWNTLNERLDPSEPRKGELRKLKNELESVWHQIWNANSEEQIREYNDEIKEIDGGLADLFPLLGRPRQAGARARPEDSAAIPREELAAALTEAKGDLVLTFEASSAPLPEKDIPDEAPSPRFGLGRSRQRSGFRRSLMALAPELPNFAFAFAVAILTGITALYINEAWGTKWDYLTAFSWGLVTPSALAGVAAVFRRFGETAALGRG